MKKTKNKEVSKPWGKYIVLEKDKNHWIKKLFVKEGERISLQSHKHRLEIWVVLSGKIKATKGNSTKEMSEGDFIKIDKKEKHRIEGINDAWVLEAALGKVKENDITRYQDDYGREK